jgi:hypothetical protein
MSLQVVATFDWRTIGKMTQPAQRWSKSQAVEQSWTLVKLPAPSAGVWYPIAEPLGSA